MTLDNYLQEAGALATLSGILAGFAFSAVVQFLSNDRWGKLYTAAIVVFSVSTLMFLFSLIMRYTSSWGASRSQAGYVQKSLASSQRPAFFSQSA